MAQSKTSRKTPELGDHKALTLDRFSHWGCLYRERKRVEEGVTVLVLFLRLRLFFLQNFGSIARNRGPEKKEGMARLLQAFHFQLV